MGIQSKTKHRHFRIAKPYLIKVYANLIKDKMITCRVNSSKPSNKRRGCIYGDRKLYGDVAQRG
jgi:hypothetical protein